LITVKDEQVVQMRTIEENIFSAGISQLSRIKNIMAFIQNCS